MVFKVLTLFPEMIYNATNYSILKRAQEKGIIKIEAFNFRNWTKDKHKRVDDYPYGGGAGMVLSAQPIYDAFMDIKTPDVKKVIYLSPQGKIFNQDIAEELSKEKEIVLICGHYEGIDERVIKTIVTDEISIGDYVLSGGEFAALVVIDAVARLVEGVIERNSLADESFTHGLLEYPQYTRPDEILGIKVPDILLSGNHEQINKWRELQSILRTIRKRPDLIKKYGLNKEQRKLLIRYCDDKNFMI